MRAKEELPECPVATAVSLIGGKWKLLILRSLKERPWRFNELQRSIDGISQKVLTDSLRQMMSDGLAYRHDYHEQPPRVEYGLTELGTKMLPIVNSLADFGNYYKSIIEQNSGRQYLKSLNNYKGLFNASLSDKGSVTYYNGEKYFVPADEALEIVDTTGCGDSYHAGFVCSHMLIGDIYEAMRVGTEFATETLSHYGGF